MTHPYTKLAEELDALAKCNEALFTASGATPIREAASILRAAASVDVAGLMALYTDCKDALLYNDDAINTTESTLESALRLALAVREGSK